MHNSTPEPSIETFHISGKIIHVDLEGGFWGILTDEGQELKPSPALEAAFQQVDLKIKAEIVPIVEIGIHMWGTPVKVLSISKVD